ncbi:TPA: hypothetical protein ACXJST_000517 [Stenotrophomonas maltophilia]
MSIDHRTLSRITLKCTVPFQEGKHNHGHGRLMRIPPRLLARLIGSRREENKNIEDVFILRQDWNALRELPIIPTFSTG